MCAPCYSSLPQPKLCPECHGLYENPVRRSLAVERLIARTAADVSCGNWSCGEMIQGVKMAEHMAECRHRTVPCPYSGCSRKKLLNSVGKHVKVHNAYSCGRDINMKVNLGMSIYKNQVDGNWFPIVCEVQGQRFFVQCLHRNKVLMAWVKVEGGREEAVQWRATISVLSSKKNDFCEFDVFPIDVTSEDIINSGDCFVKNKKELEKFYTTDGLPIKICLMKV